MKKLLIPIFILGSVLFSSCGESDIIAPYGSKAVSQQVTVTRIDNYPGRSVIHFSFPDDINLRYVKAVYEPRQGQIVEKKASFYTDSLTVEGFESAAEYNVKLYSVSYGETLSEPVSAIVQPQTPPYLDTFEGLDIEATFGGVYVLFDNPEKDDLAITVRKKNDQDMWEDVYTHYTDAASGKFSIRGQEAEATAFGVKVTDRWGNTTSLKDTVLTPLYEIQCDKSRFKKMMLAGDTYQCHTWSTAESKLNDMTYLWDGKPQNTPCFQTPTTGSLPQHFTVDLGAEYKLSRFCFWSRYTTDCIFKAGHIREFELYGSKEYNPSGVLYDADGVLDPSWFFLGHFESFRPSGAESMVSTADPLTNEEKTIMDIGEEWMLEDECPSVRYIRVRSLRSWGNVVYICLSEISFFGQEVGAEQ